MTALLRAMFAGLTSPVEKRLFAEYGAIFVTNATPPPAIIFSDAAAVEAFQASLPVSRARIGDYEIALQTEAMDALIRAAAEINDQAGQITARAQGDAAAFDKVYEQYKLAPDVTKRRMYYETMERVLGGNDKVIVESQGVTPYLPLPEFRRKAAADPQATASAAAPQGGQ